MIKIGIPLPGNLVLDSVSSGSFFGHLLIWPDGGRTADGGNGRTDGRTLAPGGTGERNRRFAQKRIIPKHNKGRK